MGLKTQQGNIPNRASTSKLLRMLVLMTTFMSLARAEGEGKYHKCVYRLYPIRNPSTNTFTCDSRG